MHLDVHSAKMYRLSPTDDNTSCIYALCTLAHLASDTVATTHNPLYPSPDSIEGHTSTHACTHTQKQAQTSPDTCSHAHTSTHAFPSGFCRRWWWPVFGKLMAVCSSQPSRLITPVDWCLDSRATTQRHYTPPCLCSHMLTTFVRNVNGRLRTLCAKW